MANFLHALAAVMAGNAAYFVLMPYLPPPARHVTYRMDLGLVVDFCFCLICLVIIKAVAGWKRDQRSSSEN